MRTSFSRKLIGSAGKLGRFGLVGIAVGAIAAITTILTAPAKDAEGATTEMQKGLNQMSKGLESMGNKALEWAGTGAMFGMMFGPLGIAVGAAVGGLIGAVVGLLSLTDTELKEFTDGIAKVWDELKKTFLRNVADMFKALLPDSMVPDWAREHGTSEQLKADQTQALLNKRDKTLESVLSETKTKEGTNLSSAQQQQINLITATREVDIRKSIEELGIKLDFQDQNELQRRLVLRNMAKRDATKAKEDIGKEERMVEGLIDEELEIKARLMANMPNDAVLAKETQKAVVATESKIEEFRKRLAKIQGKDSPDLKGTAVSIEAGQGALNLEKLDEHSKAMPGEGFIPVPFTMPAQTPGVANPIVVNNNHQTQKSVSVSYPLAIQMAPWSSVSRLSAAGWRGGYGGGAG